MSEYLFRGKAVDKWVYGLPSYNNGAITEIEILIYDKGIYYSNFVDVDPETIGQSVDAADVNEKEIFDGDKVNFTVFDYEDNDTQYTGVVVFFDGHWQIWAAKDSPYYGSDGGFDLYWVLAQDDTLEVFGNIHEVTP